jgi:ectoine hydroxylase-related dioxygenase (phytanoyl-CoA dioxygenase family)
MSTKTAGIDRQLVESFVRDGYVVVPNVVARDRVEAVIQAINARLGEGIDTDQLTSFRAGSYFPEVASSPLVMDLLYDTPVEALAEQLVGAPLDKTSNGQIALRFPQPPGSPPVQYSAHIDGIPTPHNGVPQDGRLHGFTVLACVLLSDASNTESGNFTCWPGTHHDVAAWVREHDGGIGDGVEFTAFLEELARMRGASTQVTGQAGDVVLAHYQLVHAAGVHVRPELRYAIFYRLNRVGRKAFADKLYVDPWVEFDTIDDELAQNAR